MITADTKWLRWLKSVTREDTVRGIARAAGVSHTTVQRWVMKGIPPDKAWELTWRFNGDPISTLLVLERVTPEQVSQANWCAVVRYAPAEVLTGELDRRAKLARKIEPERIDAPVYRRFGRLSDVVRTTPKPRNGSDYLGN